MSGFNNFSMNGFPSGNNQWGNNGGRGNNFYHQQRNGGFQQRNHHQFQPQQQAQHHPNELFVGDLSFFCREEVLLQLFGQFGVVESCRVVRNDARRRSLMFGFVCMATLESAMQAMVSLGDQMYMGRTMK